MINIWRKIIKTGIVTQDYELLAPAKEFRGELSVDMSKCYDCTVCVSACPVHAINIEEKNNARSLTIDYTKCFYCGICVDFCPTGALSQTNRDRKSTKHRRALYESFHSEEAIRGETYGSNR